MRKTVLMVLVVSAGVLAQIGGCEKEIREANAPAQPSSPPVAVATTQPGDGAATVAAAQIPATSAKKTPATQSQPALSMLTINGLGAEFPPTKLLLHERGADGKITAELFSDLPKSALRKYDGNELYLEMQLDAAPSAKPAPDANPASDTWHFKSVQSGRVDSPNGIFLHGQATHLQPFDVWVKFDRDEANRLVARIVGQFRAYESNTPDAIAPEVGVNGALAVEIAKQR
jgi:hypothetical protein